MDTYSRGQLAKKARVSIETLRYYEKIGLIPKPERSKSDYRQYPKNTVERIRFIKNAQKLGFSLKEIKELLSISLVTHKQCSQMKKEIDLKLKEVQGKTEKLKEIENALKSLRKSCDKGGFDGNCPILNILYGGLENEN